MSSSLFRVDLSDGARDFQPTATEPGLAMLDRNGANHAVLRRWLGDYIAEPQWQGQAVLFHVRDEQHGRLDDLHCIPCTKADLLGPLQGSLEEIDEKLRKVQPETSTEQLLHRIIRQQFATLTKDYDSSDFHCYFFKYRQPGQRWRLVWCWGYQRTDLEPAKALICANPECGALYLKRPRQKARCPVCASTAVRGTKPPASPLMKVLTWGSLALLLLLAGLFFYLGQPQLEISPQQYSGPPGSRVEYKINRKAWFFFNSDVTAETVPQSSDTRVLKFARQGTLGKAQAMGSAVVTMHYGNLKSNATVRIGPPLQPKSIVIEPAGDVRLAIGSTKQLKLMGHYDKLDPVDLTELAEWEQGNKDVVFVNLGKLEGAAEGVTKITARYRANEKEKFLDSASDVVVTKVDYKSIELAVDPRIFGIGQSARIDAWGLDAKGDRYSLSGSSLLKLNVMPVSAATIEEGYLVGKEKGKAQLAASLLDLKQSTDFDVGDGSLLAAGTFAVSPTEVKLGVDEYMLLDVVSGSNEPIKAVSSNPKVVETIGSKELAGRGVGSATVTVTQGNHSQVVNVTVTESNFASLHIDPPMINLISGQPRGIRVYGKTKSGNEIAIAPDRLTWVKQPPIEYAELNRDSLEIFGIGITPEPYPLVAQLGTNEAMRAEAKVSVGASPLASTTTISIDVDEFLVYPPINGMSNRVLTLDTGSYLGNDLVWRDGGVAVGEIGGDSVFHYSGLPAGTVITGVNGFDFAGKGMGDVRDYFLRNPVVQGDVITYRMANGDVGRLKLGITGRIVQDVRLVDVRPEDLGATDFTAIVDLELREGAEYRVTNAAGEALSDWKTFSPNSAASIVTGKIPRSTTDEYDLIIERRMGDQVKRYPYSITLKTETR